MSQDRDDDGTDVVPADGSSSTGAAASTAKARRSGASAVPTGKAGRGSEVTPRRDADEAEDSSTPHTNPISYMGQVVEELRRVIWPTRGQMVTYTVVVFLFLVLLTALVSGVDFGAGKLVELVFMK